MLIRPMLVFDYPKIVNHFSFLIITHLFHVQMSCVKYLHSAISVIISSKSRNIQRWSKIVVIWIKINSNFYLLNKNILLSFFPTFWTSSTPSNDMNGCKWICIWLFVASIICCIIVCWPKSFIRMFMSPKFDYDW